MSNRSLALISTFALGAVITLIVFASNVSFMAMGIAVQIDPLDPFAAYAGWTPFAATSLVVGAMALRWHLRAPDIIIRVTDPPTPLTAKFLEQDRRLERREQLKRQLFDLNGEIETFAADMDEDTRKAWFNRPGPYGK